MSLDRNFKNDTHQGITKGCKHSVCVGWYLNSGIQEMPDKKSKTGRVRNSAPDFDDPHHFISDAEQIGKSYIEVFSATGSNPTGDTNRPSIYNCAVTVGLAGSLHVEKTNQDRITKQYGHDLKGLYLSIETEAQIPKPSRTCELFFHRQNVD